MASARVSVRRATLARALLAGAALPLACLPLLAAMPAALAQDAPATSRATPASGPVINRVVFEGNNKLTDDTLVQAVEMKPRTTYNPAAVAGDVQRLREFYARSGRAAVTITPRVVPLPNNRIDLVYHVDEGSKIGVDEIRFVGNNAFGAWRLKRQMQTVESGFLSFLRTTDTYDPARIQSDEDILRRFYADRGYPDFKVVSTVATLNEKQDAYIITITVDEGQHYDFGNTSVQSSVPSVDPKSLEGYIQTSPGSGYDENDVDKSVEGMTDELSRRGLAFAQVRPRGTRDPSTGRINIDYVVEEGAKVYVERINIRGNTRTRDYVIRREFDIAEGDAYNRVLVDRAVRRLRNLGYFDTVRVSTEPGTAADQVIIDVDVTDQSTGEFSIGGGYATNDGFIGEVSLSERNFLGRGQYVKVAVQYGQNTKGAQFSFTEPYFLGQRIAAGFDVFSKTTDDSSYAYYRDRETGGTLRATFPITDDFSVGVNYTAYEQKITVPNDDFLDNNLDNGEASLAIKDILGSRFVSEAGYTLTYDTLDDRKVPSSGIFGQIKQTFAGLGGDATFIRTTGDLRYYYPITDDLTGMLRGQAGYINGLGDKLAIVDQFNLGPELVRGFAPGGIGPRDISGGSGGNPLGGTLYYGGTAELQFPLLGLPRELNLRGALFVDAGVVQDYGGRNFAAPFDLRDSDTLRSSVGASVLWASPFGPLRFDYAYVLSKDTYDQRQAFHFSGGTSF